jgi:hypothetical protein
MRDEVNHRDRNRSTIKNAEQVVLLPALTSKYHGVKHGDRRQQQQTGDAESFERIHLAILITVEVWRSVGTLVNNQTRGDYKPRTFGTIMRSLFRSPIEFPPELDARVPQILSGILSCYPMDVLGTT